MALNLTFREKEKSELVDITHRCKTKYRTFIVHLDSSFNGQGDSLRTYIPLAWCYKYV